MGEGDAGAAPGEGHHPALDGTPRTSDTRGVTFHLAHLSDPHIGPLPPATFRELAGKRLTGWINWHRGRHALHNMEVLAAIVADVQAQNPDHIAVSGDILNLGLSGEFPRAAAFLASVGEPARVSFVPGNHDAYTQGCMLTLARTFAPWTQGHATLPDADLAAEGLKPYPYVRQMGDVALIGVTSGVPMLPFLASGRMGRDQAARLAQVLDTTAAQGLCRVVMIHHPPTRRGATPGRGLTDSRAFERIIAAHGAELVIHGHNHRHQVIWLAGPSKPVPVVGVASASAVPGTPNHRAAYHIYRLTRAKDGWQVTVRARGLLPGSRTIGELDLPPLTPPA